MANITYAKAGNSPTGTESGVSVLRLWYSVLCPSYTFSNGAKRKVEDILIRNKSFPHSARSRNTVLTRKLPNHPLTVYWS